LSTSSALAKYRELVGAHARVPNGLVEAWITEAATALDATRWGSRYEAALVWWAAHHVETDPAAAGLCGERDTLQAGPLTHKTDSEGEGTERKSKSRTYAAPASSGNASDDDFRTTVYGRRFLDLRRSRAAGAPRVIRQGC
jgi:hypothetical protein